MKKNNKKKYITISLLFIMLLLYIIVKNSLGRVDLNKNTNEELLYKTFTKKIRKEDAKFIIELLPLVNWKGYSNLENEKKKYVFELYKLHKYYNSINSNDLESLFKAYVNSDGYYAEDISALIYNVYQNNPTIFEKNEKMKKYNVLLQRIIRYEQGEG